MKEIFEKVSFEKNSAYDKSMKNYPAYKVLSFDWTDCYINP